MNLVEKYNKLVGLVKAVRAYSWTPACDPDEGREHPLYPSKNRHNRFPLWQAINELLVEEKTDEIRVSVSCDLTEVHKQIENVIDSLNSLSIAAGRTHTQPDRERFEDWVKSQPFFALWDVEGQLDRDEIDGGYLEAITHAAWLAWCEVRK